MTIDTSDLALPRIRASLGDENVSQNVTAEDWATLKSVVESARDALVNGTSGVFNVKDYGAVGDGVTNDTSAVQSAVSALHSYGHGRLVFPSGTYILSDVVRIQTSNIDVVGIGNAKIKAASAYAGNSPYHGRNVFEHYNTSTGKVANVRYLNLGFDTNQSTQTQDIRMVMLFAVTGFTVIGCWLDDSSSNTSARSPLWVKVLGDPTPGFDCSRVVFTGNR